MAVFRFAPSPNGYLHLGHAYSAVTSYRMAEAMGAQFLLRIEDIDQTRAREKYVSAIFEDLLWLGLRWPEPVVRQSEHLAHYERAGAQLKSLGLIYPCFCTRKQIAAAVSSKDVDPDGAAIYSGVCKSLPKSEVVRLKAAGRRFAMRLNMERALKHIAEDFGEEVLCFSSFDVMGETKSVCLDPRRWGDVIVQRKEVATSYHLSVVIDDARQGVSHIVRGRDLFEATSVHRLLQLLLHLPAPYYHHHDLVLDENGAKLSKSDHATSIKSLREDGWSREDVLQRIGLY